MRAPIFTFAPFLPDSPKSGSFAVRMFVCQILPASLEMSNPTKGPIVSQPFLRVQRIGTVIPDAIECKAAARILPAVRSLMMPEQSDRGDCEFQGIRPFDDRKTGGRALLLRLP